MADGMAVWGIGFVADRMTMFQRGDFRLASGQRSSWKIDCDALTDEDWHGLAAMLVDYLPEPFFRVVGVPRGGIPLATALQLYASSDAESVLVVDDVWTTGGSMQRFIDADVQRLETHNLMRAVAFARNPPPVGVTALFVMPRQQAPRRRVCSACGRSVMVRENGQLHSHRTGESVRCRGGGP